jgi:hypothetical protein
MYTVIACVRFADLKQLLLLIRSTYLSQTYCVGTRFMFHCVYFSLQYINYVFCLVRISVGNFGKPVAIFMHGCILKWQKY